MIPTVSAMAELEATAKAARDRVADGLKDLVEMGAWFVPGTFIADAYEAEDDAHIAANSPEVTLALIQEIRDLRASLRDMLVGGYYGPKPPADRAEALLARAEAK